MPGTYQEEGTIPQALLPLIADGATRISDFISVVRENGLWTYFCGAQPVFHHTETDRQSFRMFTAQLICQGACRQVDIVRAFGVSKQSVIRSVNKYLRRGRESVLHASCDTRRYRDDAGGHRPGTTVAGGWLEPKRSRRAPGP